MISLALWTIQGLLALLFLLAGSTKLLMPDETVAQMALPLPEPFILFIGFIELAGALGLVFPHLLRVRPGLTSLAACGLVIDMLGATGYTALSGDLSAALMPLGVGLLCAAVAFGRRESLINDPLLASLLPAWARRK